MRRYEALVNLLLGFGPFAVVTLMVLSIGLVGGAPLFWGCTALGPYALGFCLFLAAKVSVIRRGMPVSFGSARMSSGFRVCYRVGYALMAFAAVLTLGVVLAAPQGRSSIAQGDAQRSPGDGRDWKSSGRGDRNL